MFERFTRKAMDSAKDVSYLVRNCRSFVDDWHFSRR